MRRRSVLVSTLLLALILTESAAFASRVPPNREDVPGAAAPLARADSNACYAAGTWTDDLGQGQGSWTKSAKAKCNPRGVWTDGFGYTWKVKKAAGHTLQGKVNYNGLTSCKANVWPVMGTIGANGAFTATAMNPATDLCSRFFTYSLQIQ